VGAAIDVVAAILRHNGKVLAVSDLLAGFWEFPGGKIEAGESPEQSLTSILSSDAIHFSFVPFVPFSKI
jgi:8-oxo-dGTP diphosphatase